MVVGIKDSVKLVGIIIISFCAVFVCTLFLNFNLDVRGIESQITDGQMRVMYDAQIATSKVVCLVSGLCLLLTSIVMLVFYVKHYVDTHRRELGILKAMGYSSFAVSLRFWVFGLSVLLGCGLAFGCAYATMPYFYDVQNAENLLPQYAVNFHPILLLTLVVSPTVFFAVLACGYAYLRLKAPTINLLKEIDKEPKSRRAPKIKDTAKERSFVMDLTMQTLKSRKTLVFFIIFAAFCFSAMTQMAFSMKDLSSETMGVMILIIGLVLAFTTLFISVTTVVEGNKKSIALLKVMGYGKGQCTTALLGGYRPFAYVGFALGTVYQYVLLRIMVDVVFKDFEGIPEYEFEWVAMLVSLAVFAVVYELVMLLYSYKISKVSVKKIMLE